MSCSRSVVEIKRCVNVIFRLSRATAVTMKSAYRHGAQEGAHGVRHIGPLQRVSDLRLEESILSRNRSLALVAQPVERLRPDQFRHAVGELHLAAGARSMRAGGPSPPASARSGR